MILHLEGFSVALQRSVVWFGEWTQEVLDWFGLHFGICCVYEKGLKNKTKTFGKVRRLDGKMRK